MGQLYNGLVGAKTKLAQGTETFPKKLQQGDVKI
jgi:hypothetical protein